MNLPHTINVDKCHLKDFKWKIVNSDDIFKIISFLLSYHLSVIYNQIKPLLFT